MNKPLVAIIGRANVGKSTLFNRLLGSQLAITHHQAGTTRDTTQRLASWGGKNFWLSDSAGLEKQDNTKLNQTITAHSRKLFTPADLLLLVIDAQTGLTTYDRNIATELKPVRSKVLLIVNKADNQMLKNKFFNQKILGFETMLVSAKNGQGTSELLDYIVHNLKTSANPPPAIKLVLLGKPNVGKSSLINAIGGESRSLVDPTPHTTRDSQYLWLDQIKYHWCVVDTAGIRRQSRAADKVENLSVKQTLTNLKESNVAVLILDSSLPFSWQDQSLADLIIESRRPVMIVVNKIDTLKEFDQKLWDKTLDRWLPMFTWAPKLFVSAQTGHGLASLLPTAAYLYDSNQYRLTNDDEDKLDHYLHRLFSKNLKIKFLKVRQLATEPAMIEIKLISKEGMPKALPDIIEKTVRKTIPTLSQVPIKLAINIKAKL